MGAREQWDEEWRRVGRIEGWRLPTPAPWPLRLWGVRYVRAAVASARLIQRHELWRHELRHAAEASSTYEDWVVYAIARGWC